MKQEREQTDGHMAQTRLRRTVWRWHFYAGIFVVPIVLIASVTGLLYVFRAELEPIIYKSLLTVKSEEPAELIRYEQQYTAALDEVPTDSRLIFMEINPSGEVLPKRTTLFRFKLTDGDQRFVYVNPYTGKVAGSINRSQHFFEIVLKLHRQLYLGNIGRCVVELGTSWSIVLALTGLYLWIPRGKSLISPGVLWPRLRVPRYSVLRDLHVIPAFFFSPLIITVLATGLFFSLVWGSAYRYVAFTTKSFPETLLQQPKSTIPDSELAPVRLVSLDKAVEISRSAGLTTHTLRVVIPKNKNSTYTVYAKGQAGPSVAAQIYLDQYTGEILSDSRNTRTPLMTAALRYALPIHQGSVLGLPTKILAFFTASVLLVLCITGYWMWWTRRPRGKLGLPARHRNVKKPRWMWLIIASFPLLVPITGLSLAVVLLADCLWARIRTHAKKIA